MRYINKKSEILFDQEQPSGVSGDIQNYTTRLYRTGPILELEAMPAYQSRSWASVIRYELGTPEAQCKVNERRSLDLLRRLIQLNFVEHVDYRYDGTYFDEYLPSSPEQAMKDFENHLNKLRREYAKRGVPLKYIWVPVVLTSKGRPKKRPHFHAIINAGVLTPEELEELWPYGRANVERLKPDKDGLVAIAKYLNDQGRVNGQKRWSCSRNLKRPEPEYPKQGLSKRRAEKLAKDYELARSAFEKQFKGYVFLSMEVRYSSVIPGAYLYVRMRRRDTWHKPTPKRRE